MSYGAPVGISYPPSPPSTPSSSPSSSSIASSLIANKNGFYSLLKNAKSAAPPLLSPASSTDSLEFFGVSGTFLERVFSSNSSIVNKACSVENLDAWKLALVDDIDANSRTLYAKSTHGVEHVCLRDSVVALLDHADEALDCDQVIVVLEKDDEDLAQLLHSLMYVGGTVISPLISKHDEAFVLVGLDI